MVGETYEFLGALLATILSSVDELRLEDVHLVLQLESVNHGASTRRRLVRHSAAVFPRRLSALCEYTVPLSTFGHKQRLQRELWRRREAVLFRLQGQTKEIASQQR